jgi:predicted RNase H-like nuclease (RuvC/YqgF family)
MSISVPLISAVTLAMSVFTAILALFMLSLSKRDRQLLRSHHEKCDLFTDLEDARRALDSARRESNVYKGQLHEMTKNYLDATKADRAGAVSPRWKGMSRAADPKDREIEELRCELADARWRLERLKADMVREPITTLSLLSHGD